MHTTTILALCLVAFIATVTCDKHWGYAPYKFAYGVDDPHTHDKKAQHEHADGHGHVDGGYTLKEADGTVRVVKYNADPHKGFRAVVERRGHAQHPHHGSSYVHTTHWGHGQGGHGGHH